MIKTPTKFIALLSGAALLTSSAFAQGVATDPVGYVTYDVAANSDVKFGSPLERSALLLDAAEAVISGTITTSVDASAATDGHYVQFTSGGLAGSWYQVSTADTSSITVAEDLTALGAVGGDSFKVVPFWTLGTLMSGFPGSTNPSAPEALVLVNDVTSEGLNPSSSASYWYYSGETGPPQGFYDSDNPSAGVQDDLILAPNTFITVRNNGISTASLVVAGSVPVDPISIDVASLSASQNDNLIFNPYPAAITLGGSELNEDLNLGTTNPSDPNKDLILVYPAVASGQNPSSSASYWYYSGETGPPQGFYDSDNPSAGVQDSITIPAGAAFVVRRGASSDAVVDWTAPLPYSL
jgi:uncharacterized protein (TIGR02597 family)